MRRSPNRLVATVVGAALVALGLLGFTATAGTGFASVDGGLLLGVLLLNSLQNTVHLLLGAALLLCGWRGPRAARGGNAIVALTAFGIGILGLFTAGTPENVLALNGGDNALHFGVAVVLLAVSVGGERPAER